MSGNPNPNPAAGWRRIYDGAMNVKWFGATGDNVTPDQTAITRAMTAAAALGKAVYFPACDPNKFYLCTASLTLPANSYGLTFRGDTVQTTTGVQNRSQIRFTAGGFVVGTSASQARWENLIVLVDNVVGAGPAFSLSVTSAQLWDNVGIYNYKLDTERRRGRRLGLRDGRDARRVEVVRQRRSLTVARAAGPSARSRSTGPDGPAVREVRTRPRTSAFASVLA